MHGLSPGEDRRTEKSRSIQRQILPGSNCEMHWLPYAESWDQFGGRPPHIYRSHHQASLAWRGLSQLSSAGGNRAGRDSITWEFEDPGIRRIRSLKRKLRLVQKPCRFRSFAVEIELRGSALTRIKDLKHP